MEIYTDLTSWALPLFIDYSPARTHVYFLCWQVSFWGKTDNEYLPDQTPEEELAELEENLKSTLELFSDWRTGIQQKMGVTTK